MLKTFQNNLKDNNKYNSDEDIVKNTNKFEPLSDDEDSDNMSNVTLSDNNLRKDSKSKSNWQVKKQSNRDKKDLSMSKE